MTAVGSMLVSLSLLGWLAPPVWPCVSPGQRSAADDVEADEGGDPESWRFDSEAHSREWLDKPLIDPADLAARPGAWEDVLASHGVALDLDRRVVYLRGATIQDPRTLGDPIEYLVVTEVGKTHEALFLVRAQPSVLHACLQAVGLVPGEHTSFELKDPPPPEEDVQAGRVSEWLVTAAHGPLIDVSVSWVDEDGQGAEATLESMLIDLRTAERLPDLGWIFTGSQFGSYRAGRDERRWFKADVEGDIVAIYLAGRNSCLFERNSLDGIEDSYYFPNPETLPPRNTSVTIAFRATGESVSARLAQEGATYDWSELDALDEPDPVPAADDGDG